MSCFVQVVDGPGVCDTRLDNKDAVMLVIRAMEQAMVTNPRGYHAFLLVVRYGVRFTAEDKDTIVILKQIFGEDFVRRFCILVMSCGDNFERDAEESGEIFEHWCTMQIGVFQDLLRECSNRVVLFDNITKDEAKQNFQIDNLLALVRGLQAQGHRYTDENFERERGVRNRAMVESRNPVMREEILQETSLILQKLSLLKSANITDQVPHLKQLIARCNELIEAVKKEDEGTGVFQDLMGSLNSVRESVSAHLDAQTYIAEERRRMKAKEKEMKRMMKEKNIRQLQDFQEMVAQKKKAEEDMRAMERELEMNETREEQIKLQLEEERIHLDRETRVLEEKYSETKERSDTRWRCRIRGFFRGAARVVKNVLVVLGFVCQ